MVGGYSDVGEYRKRAQDLRKLASTMTHEASKEALLRVAAGYDALASRLEQSGASRVEIAKRLRPQN